MDIPRRIFRAYDVRGVYGEDLTEEAAERIGRAFGSYIGAEREIIVGRDVRLSSERLQAAIINGLLSAGCSVVDIGLVPTPVLYFAVIHYRKNGGVMVTASHNPPEWNGFKLCRGDGSPLAKGLGMEEIERRVFSEDLESASPGRIERYDNVLSDYSEFILDRVSIKRRLKVAVDLGNGACSHIIPPLLRSAGMEVIPINDEPDGSFPAHKPEPTEETMMDLQRVVVEEGADFGAGFDGDGDRVLFIDEKGRMIPGDTTLIMMAHHYLERVKGGTVVYDVFCSSTVREAVERLGGNPVVSRVGRAYVMDTMRREGAVLGGEISGHIYFADVYGFDDAIYAVLKMGEILSGSGEVLSEIVDGIPHHPCTPVKFYYCPDEEKFKVVREIAESLKSAGYRTVMLDGVKVVDDDGWFLIRASNTQPKIELKVEAETEEKLRCLEAIAEREIRKNLKG